LWINFYFFKSFPNISSSSYFLLSFTLTYKTCIIVFWLFATLTPLISSAATNRVCILLRLCLLFQIILCCGISEIPCSKYHVHFPLPGMFPSNSSNSEALFNVSYYYCCIIFGVVSRGQISSWRQTVNSYSVHFQLPHISGNHLTDTQTEDASMSSWHGCFKKNYRKYMRSCSVIRNNFSLI